MGDEGRKAARYGRQQGRVFRTRNDGPCGLIGRTMSEALGNSRGLFSACHFVWLRGLYLVAVGRQSRKSP